ncbi:MAG: DUF4846 domain-containing protein, partial [Bacteroidales bacterium]|nr:DUF4846 domain-containing protein [Bacteroidales bacterium]
MHKVKELFYLIFFLISLGCSQINQNSNGQPGNEKALFNPEGSTITERFSPPAGFKRPDYDPGSFGYYLSNLSLKPHGYKVKLYNGIIKPRFWVYAAVVDMDIGNRDLQQCADAVMRLKGEYLFETKQFDKIHFNFTNGFRADYSKWMQGSRIVVKGNDVSWVKSALPSNTYSDFRKYMDVVFSYAGTLSLSKEMENIPINTIKTGDVFIQGGSPGHAVIVVDIAYDSKNNKVFLLAQSYMPAQDIQILKNPNDKSISP